MSSFATSHSVLQSWRFPRVTNAASLAVTDRSLDWLTGPEPALTADARLRRDVAHLRRDMARLRGDIGGGTMQLSIGGAVPGENICIQSGAIGRYNTPDRRITPLHLSYRPDGVRKGRDRVDLRRPLMPQMFHADPAADAMGAILFCKWYPPTAKCLTYC